RYHYYTCPSSCCPLASFFLSLFFTLRRPPYPSLFPYTTLFRSLPLALAPKLQQRARTSGAARSRPAGAGPAVAARAPALRVAHADRKSTRLNSSHVSISYAVFCLKKKIKGKTHQQCWLTSLGHM